MQQRAKKKQFLDQMVNCGANQGAHAHWVRVQGCNSKFRGQGPQEVRMQRAESSQLYLMQIFLSTLVLMRLTPRMSPV